ncbi:MAG TPA: PAS domain-containing protein, partial [Ktedonobacteraceae bacterium]
MRQKGDTYSDAMPRKAGHNVALNTALSQHAGEQLQLWQAVCATQLDYIVIYNHEGYIAQISEHVCTLLGLDDTQDPLQLPQEHAVQFFLRDEQGHILPDEQWPVSRILRGEVMKQAEAVDAYIRAIDGHEVLVSVYGAPLYDAHGHISGAVLIVREANERRKMEHRTLGIVEALLAIEEALCKESTTREDEAAYAVEQRLVALPRYLLNCQYTGMALLEPDTLALHPIALAGVSLEQERRWRHNSYGVHLRNYLGDSHLVTRLLHNEVLVFDRSLPFLSELSNWGLIAPMQRNGALTGVLLLGYSIRKSQLNSSELAMVGAVAGLAACIVEREQQRQGREQLQKAREDVEQEAYQVKRLLH